MLGVCFIWWCLWLIALGTMWYGIKIAQDEAFNLGMRQLYGHDVLWPEPE